MKFKIAIAKSGKYLLKIELDNGEEKWATTSEAVYNFTKSAFKEGDTIGLDYIEKNGQYHVNRVTKDGKVTSKKEVEKEEEVAEFTCEDCGKALKDGKYKKCFLCNKKNPAKKKVEKEEVSEYVCEDCGKPLKDGKYKKCYTCNQKNPVKSTSSERSSDTQESIKTQVSYKVAGQAILAFTGQISDLDTLKAHLDDIANHVREKF
jgi:predicted RNA-binding Zn-ribbon protein involved in translation (DUF1610 family)